MVDPLQIIKAAIKEVPIVKYGLGIVGIAACIALIKSLNIGKFDFILLLILAMIFLMILLYVFANFTNSKDPMVKITGRLLIFTVVVIPCLVCFLFLSAFVTMWPPQCYDLLCSNN